MKEVVAYVRVSTIRQGEQGVSLPQQRDAIAQYAQSRGLQIIEWFEEQQSASKRGRPIFKRLLALLSERRTVGVVVHKIDRSTRNMTEWAEIEELLDMGIDVFFAGEGLDLRSRGGRLAAGIQAVVASDYSRNLSDEARKGFYGRLKQGVYPGPAPIGYANAGRCKPKILAPLVARLVREAFEVYASGSVSLRQLSKEMATRGLRNKYGRSLRLGELAKVLHNPFYIGLMRIKKTGEVFEGKHEPLISQRLFERVQTIMAGRKVRPVRRHDFLFRQLIRCAQCHRLLVGERQKGHVYYRCHNETCRRVSVREEAIETELRWILSRLTFSEDDNTRMLQELRGLQAESTQFDESKRQGLQLRRAQIGAKLDRLTDAYLDATIDKDAFKERKTTLLMERRDVEDSLQQLDVGQPGVTQIADVLELANNACLLYERASVAEKRELIEVVSSNREVHGKTLIFTLVPVFAEVVNRSNRQFGAPARDRVRTGSTERCRLSKRYWQSFLKRVIAEIDVSQMRVPACFSHPQKIAA